MALPESTDGSYQINPAEVTGDIYSLGIGAGQAASYNGQVYLRMSPLLRHFIDSDGHTERPTPTENLADQLGFIVDSAESGWIDEPRLDSAATTAIEQAVNDIRRQNS